MVIKCFITLIGILLILPISVYAVATQELEVILKKLPAPGEVRQELDNLEARRPGEPGISLSTWHRVRAILLSRDPSILIDTVMAELDLAEQAIKGSDEPGRLEALAKVNLNRAIALRNSLDRDLQRSVVYGMAAERFFEILEQRYHPAQNALTEGRLAAVDTPLLFDFDLAEASLNLSLAHAADAFLGDPSVSQRHLSTAKAVAERVQHAASRGECGQDLLLAALNVHALALLYGSEPLIDGVTLHGSIVAEMKKGISDLRMRAALAASRISLSRRLEDLALLDEAVREGENSMRKLQAEQVSLMGSEGSGKAAALFDDFSFLASTVILGLLDLGREKEAFAAVQRAKWTTVISAIPDQADNFERLCAALARDDAILAEQFLSHQGLLTFVVSSNGHIRVHRTKGLTAHELVSLVVAWRSQVSAPSATRLLVRGRPVLYLETLMSGRLLAKVLLEDTGLREAATNGQRVLIAPHLILSYLSYAALPTSINEANPLASRFVIDDWPPISLVPGSLLLSLDEPKQSQWAQDIVYFLRTDFTNQEPRYGSDLPGVGVEVAHSRKILDGPVFAEAAATKNAFWEHAGSTRIIYLATHGIANSDSPLDSHLLLAKSANDDGRLRVQELLNLRSGEMQHRLTAELAILAACVTAISEKQPMYSDDLASMVRGMLAAGVQNVLGTQWEAHDNTYARLMPAMLEEVAGGTPPSAALWSAQKDFLVSMRCERSLLASPFFWGSAVMFE